MRTTVLLAVLLAFPAAVFAQLPLPQPLQLPPGLEQTLPISKAGSYFSEAVKIQDCPDDEDNPLGLCNNLLFGGMAMFISQLSGNIRIKFYPPVNNISQFEITHPGGMTGDPAVERAPILYEFPISSPTFTDEERLTQGRLNLITGEVTNLVYRLCISSNILEAYKNLNPSLTGCSVELPGIYGTAIGRFEQRTDGLLDFTFFGSTFAPLGNNHNGKGDNRVRVPLPFCPAPGNCPGLEAPGTSLRPRIRVSTREPDTVDCGLDCPNLPVNTVQVFTTSAYHSSMGDRFTRVNIPELGGGTVGSSQLSGRLYVQFGDRYGDLVPVAIWAMLPEGFLAEPPAFPFAGFQINMLGADGKVTFPNYTYEAVERVWVSDPFDFAVGVFNVRTGKSVGDFVFRGLPFQTLLTVILQLNAGRIPTDTFRFQGPAAFERGPNGSLVFRYDGGVFLNFSTFLWPTPDYNPAYGFRAGEGSLLEPFLKFQASAGGEPARAFKSGDISEVSHFGDPIRIHYSIPCDVSEKSFSFNYTNSADAPRGGTFVMDSLTAVSCTNAHGSAAGPGEADIVSFAGTGSWSKDTDPHLATVQISTAPGAAFYIVQIDGVLSSADTALEGETFP
jgi:hypothetical protein